MKAKVRTAMMPKMTNGLRLRLAGASAAPATTTAGAAAVSGVAARGCGRSLIAGVGCRRGYFPVEGVTPFRMRSERARWDRIR